MVVVVVVEGVVVVVVIAVVATVVDGAAVRDGVSSVVGGTDGSVPVVESSSDPHATTSAQTEATPSTERERGTTPTVAMSGRRCDRDLGRRSGITSQDLTESKIGSRLHDVDVEPVDKLRDHGLQVTAQRIAVLRAVSASPHSTPNDVAEAVREQIGSISRQSVYDTLTLLADNGIIRRIQPAGSPTRYEDRVGDNHHHLVCRSCSRLVDVDCAVGDTPCLIPHDDSQFEVDEAEVVYWGICPECRTSTP